VEKSYVAPELLDSSAFYPLMRSINSFIMPATVLMGWEAGAPVSVLGSILVTIFNLALIINGVLRIGGVLLIELKKFLRNGGRMDNGPHYLICGGDATSLEIVATQLTNDALDEKRLPLTFLIDEEVEKVAEYIKDHYGDIVEIRYVIGSMINDGDLEKAGLRTAVSVLLLPSESIDENEDIPVLLAAKTITRIMPEKASRPQIVAKLNNPLYGDILVGIADQVVCSSEIDFKLAASALFSEGLADVYRNVLQVSPDTNEIYVSPNPKKFIGMKFSEISAILDKASRKTNNPISMIGIHRDGHIILNPPESKVDKLRPDDRLVVFAYRFPDRQIAQIASDSKFDNKT
jgi:hypothetical protein